jgi:hypothetical protein
MPRYRSLGAAAVAILPVMILSPAPGRAEVQRGTDHRAAVLSPQWRMAVNLHYGQVPNASGYSEILTVGRVVWAFGGTNPGGQSSPVAMFLAGRTWHESPLPGGLTNFISTASAPKPNDIWAISEYGGYVLHWNGRRWSLAKSWSQSGQLTGVVAISSRNVWVFGTSPGGDRTIGTWHFNGRAWKPVVSAAGRDIYRASAVSAHDIWAIAAGPKVDSIERFGYRGWRHVRTGRMLVGARWHDILAESEDDVWILGTAASRQGTGRLVLAHWNGRYWTRFNTSLQAWAGQLAATGTGSIIATAMSSGLAGDGLIIEMTGSGHLTWSTIASSLGSGVTDVAYAPESHMLWASGGVLTRLGGNAALWTLALPHSSQRADPAD